MKRIALFVAAFLLVSVAPPLVARAAQPAGDCDWASLGHDATRTYAQLAECTTLSPATASSLRPDWAFQAPDSVTASPAVHDGRVYVGSWNGDFYAFDAGAGPGVAQPLWTFRIDDTNDTSFGRIVSSAAVVERRVAGGEVPVVLFAGGSTLYALDGRNGKKLGSICLDPRSDPAVRCLGGDEKDVEVESSPAVVELGGRTLVLIGNDVHNQRDVGRTGMIALHMKVEGGAVSFTPVWKFDPEAGEAYHADDGDRFGSAEDILTHGFGTGWGCGGVWSSAAVDAASKLVFFGTSSCKFAGEVDAANPGKAPAWESVFAVDLRTGNERWRYHPPRVDTRDDDDFGAVPNLLPGGRVGIGGKDGWYYAFDRTTGELAWRTRVGQSGHVNEDFAVGGALGSAAVGEVAGEPAVFVTQAIATPIDRPMDRSTPDRWVDGTLAKDPQRLLSLHAISAEDGRVLWRSPLPRATYGSASYADGVVLVPSTAGFSLQAFDADSGAPLWAHPLNGPPASTAAVVGDRVFLGTGTRQTDAEYKAFGAGALDGTLGASPLSPLSGVMSFRVTLP